MSALEFPDFFVMLDLQPALGTKALKPGGTIKTPYVS